MSDAHHPAIRTVQSLAVLLDLGRRARGAGSAQELAFQLVNDTNSLTPYRQAVLWAQDAGVLALSGVVQPDANAPYVQWLTQLLDATTPIAGSAVLPLSAGNAPPALAADWASWLPAHALLLRVPTNGPATAASPRTTLLLGRDHAWTDEDQRLLCEWVDTWHHAYAASQRTRPGSWRGLGFRVRQHLLPQTGQRWWRQRRLQWLAGLLAVLCLPVRLSVMAPGELVPAQPVVVRAPMEGVIDTFHVQPNQTVRKDQPLFGFDEALIQSRLNVAAQALATAEAEYRQGSQQALVDPRSKAQLTVFTGKIEEKRAERDYLQDQLGRARVLAPRDGVALFDDPSEWIGRPIATGERILRIAATDDREVEAWLAVGDAIALGPNAPVKLYLNASPLRPVNAQLRYVSHDAAARPDGSFAYRVRATLTEQTDHRVGLKGTVRLQGDWTPLAYWMLRRPLAALRTNLGL